MYNSYDDPKLALAADFIQSIAPDPTPVKIPGRELAVILPADEADEEIQPPYLVAFGNNHTRHLFANPEFETLDEARDFIERAFTEGYEFVRGQLGYCDNEGEDQWPYITHAVIQDEYTEDVELLCAPDYQRGLLA